MVDSPKTTVSDFEAYLARFTDWQLMHNYSPKTVETRERALRGFFTWAEMRSLTHPKDVTRPILQRYQRHLYFYRKKDGNPLSFRTQASRLTPIRAFFKWLARENHILYNPAGELDMPRPEQRLPKAILSAQEVERVLLQADIETPAGLRDRAIMELLYATAMRRAEAAGLKLWDIDYGRRAITIREGKGGKDRIVPLSERLEAWLVKYRDEARPRFSVSTNESTLFINRFGQPIEDKRLTKNIGKYVRAAGIKKQGACHLFRHTAATLMLENGADIRFIQALLGHASLETTQIYTQVSITKLAEIHNATHPGAKLNKRLTDEQMDMLADL
jgi:integrase/recombinase XerD